MPVSPQDFALWSNLTGNPYPETPAERMALAPEVYQFNKNLARRGGTGMSPLRRAVDVIGKTALAAGALAGAAYFGKEYFSPSAKSPDKASSPVDEVEDVTETPTPVRERPRERAIYEAPALPPGRESKSIADLYFEGNQPQREKSVSERASEYLGLYEPNVVGSLSSKKPRPESLEGYETEILSAEPAVTTAEKILAIGRARGKINDKNVGKGLVTPREAPISYSESEKEAAYADIEGYQPYSVGRYHEPVSARVSEYLGQSSAGYQKLEVDNEPNLEPTIVAEPHHAVSRTVAASGDITPPTTSDRYLQDVVPNQTAITQQARGTSPAKPTVVASEMKPATQSDVIASKQQFSPGSEIEQLGDASTERQRAEAFRKSAAYSVMQNKYEGLAPIQSSTEPASAAPETLTNVQPSPQVKVAQPADVGAALKSKGIYLSGDLESGTIQVNTEKGGTFEISHPYATHPKRGIRETALREEQAARDALQSAGVTPEQAKDYWSSKFSKPAESPVAAMAAPVKAPITSVSEPTSAVAGPSSTEIRELDTLLARSHAGHTPEQRLELRNQVLSKKYGGGPVVTPTQPPAVRVAREEAPTSGPSPESVRFARETARGMSRVGLMAQKEEGRASTYSRAQFGENPASEPTGEFRELADPRLMKALMGRQTVINPY